MRLSLLVVFAFSARAADISGFVGAGSRWATTPLSGATVSLTSLAAAGPGKRSQITDTEGRFDFADLPDGGYVLSAARVGYLSPDEDEVAVWITHGDSRTGVQIGLISQSVLCGTVTGGDGKPAANAEIRAYAVQGQSGERYFARRSVVTANQNGQYCMGDLSAGVYVLGALTGQGSDVTDVPIRAIDGFYPDADRPLTATSVAVGWGQTLDGIDIRLRWRSRRALSGVVVDQSGRCKECTVQIYATDDGFRDVLSGSVRVTGTGEFEIRGLPSGAYQLIATSPFEKETFTSREVNIGDHDVTGMVFPLEPDCRVTGSVVLETPARISDPDSIFLNLMPSAPAAIWRRERSYLNSGDLGFTIPCVVNITYRVELRNLPIGSYLKVLRMGGAELRAPEVTLTANAPPLEAVIAFDGAAIEGTVKARGRPPADRLLIALLPASRANPYLVDRFEEPDEDGSYRFVGVAPGSYVIVPVVKLANWELADPAFRD